MPFGSKESRTVVIPNSFRFEEPAFRFCQEDPHDRAELRSTGRARAPVPTWSFPNPLVHPVIHRFVPELGVLRLEHPMAFVGEVEHLRRNALALQGGEKVEPLRDV